jgi:hypothetical protein
MAGLSMLEGKNSGPDCQQDDQYCWPIDKEQYQGHSQWIEIQYWEKHWTNGLVPAATGFGWTTKFRLGLLAA